MCSVSVHLFVSSVCGESVCVCVCYSSTQQPNHIVWLRKTGQ